MKTKKVLYIVSNIFSHRIARVFTPVLRFSPLYHTYISFPLHPAFTPSLRCTSLHFPSLHFTTLFYTFRWFSLHFTSFHFLSLHFSMIFRTLYFSLTHPYNRFSYPLFKVFGLQGRVPNTSACNRFQSSMVLFTKEYFPISALCLLLLIFPSWSTLLR